MRDLPRDLDALRRGGKAALARALTALEIRGDAPEVTDLLDAAHAAPRGIALGLTGPPGVGKSTLTNALIARLRATGRSVGVVAVDPSSRRTRGALLGDRTRIDADPEDQEVFVRSMAARDALGGLAALTFPSVVLMRAVFDWVIVETVGVGQSETDVREVADLVVFCAQPGSGDALQFMKAGVTEVPDLVLVTKGDLGAAANRAASDLRGALSLSADGSESVPVRVISSVSGTGLDEAIGLVERLAAGMVGRAENRSAQAALWAERRLLDSLLREAGALIGDTAADGRKPFAALAARRERLLAALERVRQTL